MALRKRTVCVQGPPGIGKTQLLLQALGRSKARKSTLWVDVEAFTSVSDLEMSLRTVAASKAPNNPGASLGSLLDRTQLRVIFDGVESITPPYLEQLEDFFAGLLRQTSSTHFVFTSQVELHTVEIQVKVELGPLKNLDSVEVLKRLSGVSEESVGKGKGATEWLVQFSEGHPLTLRIVSSLLRYFKSTTIVADRIKRFGARTLQNQTRRDQTRQSSLNVCLALAYSALEPEERHILFVASHCPAGCPVGLIRWRDDCGVRDPQSSIAALRRWHLINLQNEPTRLSVLSPIRAFVVSTVERDESAVANDLIFKLVRVLTIQAAVIDDQYIAVGDSARGMFRFMQEFPNFIHAFDEAVRRAETSPQYFDLISLMASALQVFCFVCGPWERGAQVLHLGAKAAVRTGRPSSASRLLLQLAFIGRKLRNPELVRMAAEELVELPLSRSDRTATGEVEMAKGQLAELEARLDDARKHFQAAAESFDTLRDRSLALFEVGFILEHQHKHREALDVFEQCLALTAQTKDDVNVGSILHHIGNCSAYLAHNQDAFNAYVRSFRAFADIGAAENLSNSLSELGFLLVAFQPKATLEDVLPSDVIKGGLLDVFVQARKWFSPTSVPLPARDCIESVRKLFGLTVLVSFTSRDFLLADWADAIRSQILQPLAAQLESGVRSKAQDGVPIMYLDMTAAIIGSIAGPKSRFGVKSRPPLSFIEHLAKLCYRQYDYAWKAFRLFDWLSAYLSRRHGVEGLTPAILKVAARDSEEHGKPFVLPGFRPTLSRHQAGRSGRTAKWSTKHRTR